MTVKGGTTPACAACKYQRRKCSPNCPLAPYFPANQPKMFQNVHRLFGVSNVTKTLEKLKTKDQKEDAMRSIIYEAEMRERFPVDGCCAVIAQLRHQLHLAYEEMHYVCTNLEACRDQLITNNKLGLDSWMDFGSTSSSDAAPPSSCGVGQFFFNENVGGGLCVENVVKPLLLTLDDPCSDAMMSSNLNSIQAQMDAFQERNTIDFEAQRFNNSALFDDRHSYNETKIEDAFESSPESSLDDVAEHGCRREMRGGAVAVEIGCRRELRTAAAGFTLTTVN
ncbi:LOB domain-containing protein 27 [Perilla frutescens var. frutescens]|nr:LOB domain-containing protein 27 [Perilla frutescens var. frutescens]